LPSTFDIHVPEGPVQLGDYLDEEFPAAEAGTRAPDSFESGAGMAPAYTRGYPAMPSYESTRVMTGPGARPAVVPRKQVNMTPETMRMVDELLTQVRTYSMEKDVRNSELFHALVLCVYEARGNLDLSGVPPRGRWGSPTAAALPVALKNAFQDAVTRTRQQKR
jgi:hypothetical protein